MERDDWKFSEQYLRSREAIAERARVINLQALGIEHDRRDLADDAILRGRSVDDLEAKILREFAEPARPLGAIGMTRR